jgi:signal peptidase I
VQLNGQLLPRRPHPDATALFAGVPDEIPEDDEDYTVLEETLDERRYPIMVGAGDNRPLGEVVMPPGMVFLFGDMRARSRDNRIFGPVPVDAVLGRAAVVWLSCAAPLFGQSWLCDLRTIRWGRFFHVIR